MKKLFPLLAAIICITMAFAWQTTPKAQQHPVTKPMESARKLSFFETEAERQKQDIDTLPSHWLACPMH